MNEKKANYNIPQTWSCLRYKLGCDMHVSTLGCEACRNVASSGLASFCSMRLLLRLHYCLLPFSRNTIINES